MHTPTNLRQLCDTLNAIYSHGDRAEREGRDPRPVRAKLARRYGLAVHLGDIDLTSLPAYGRPVADPDRVWSWDDHSIIVFAPDGRFTIEPRD